MAEESIPEEVLNRDKANALNFTYTKGKKILNKIADPNARGMAKFNLINQPHHFHPSEEKNLPPLPTHEIENAEDTFNNPRIIEDPVTKQKFRTVMLHPKADDGSSGDEDETEKPRPIMYVPEYGWSAIDNGPPRLRFEELVKQSGKPVFTIDHPGWGSDPLTPMQKRALKTEEGYGPVAEAQLRIMKEMGITDVDLVGFSMGGWAAATLAEKAEAMGIKVHNLVVMEAPLGERSAVDLARAEASEANRLELYKSVPYNQKLREASGKFKSVIGSTMDLVKWGIGSTFLHGGHHYIRSMSHDILEQHLYDALESNKDLQVQIVHGTEGKVSLKENNRAMAQILRGLYGDRIHRSVYPGDSHAFMDNPQKFATAVNLAIQPKGTTTYTASKK